MDILKNIAFIVYVITCPLSFATNLKKIDKVLVVFIDYTDLKFDDEYKSAIANFSKEKIEILRARHGDEFVKKILEDLRQSSLSEKLIDKRDPIELAKSHMLVLEDYLKEVSYGQYKMNVDYKRILIPKSHKKQVHVGDALFKEGHLALEKIGISKADYDRFIFINAPISYGGGGSSADIGGQNIHVESKHLFPRIEVNVLIHEFGHSLGLQHSESIDCHLEVLSNDCKSDMYGNFLDVMGKNTQNEIGHFSSFHKEKLGWLQKSSNRYVKEIKQRGTYVVSSLSLKKKGIKGLKLRLKHSFFKKEGKEYWLYLEYRTPHGHDSFVHKYLRSQNGIVAINVVEVDQKKLKPTLLLDYISNRNPSLVKEKFVIGNIELKILKLEEDAAKISILNY